MTYPNFRRTVQSNGYPIAELRFDVPPRDEILELCEAVGLDVWEKWVTKLEKEVKAS